MLESVFLTNVKTSNNTERPLPTWYDRLSRNSRLPHSCLPPKLTDNFLDRVSLKLERFVQPRLQDSLHFRIVIHTVIVYVCLIQCSEYLKFHVILAQLESLNVDVLSIVSRAAASIASRESWSLFGLTVLSGMIETKTSLTRQQDFLIKEDSFK
jgi:hypothetical protein